jgi:hypothetical protein
MESLGTIFDGEIVRFSAVIEIAFIQEGRKCKEPSVMAISANL